MAQPTEFVRLVLELLAPVGEVRARSLFGGFGLYQRDTFFAIIADDRLYFRTDGATGRKYARLGLEPFTYVARGRRIALKYHEAPPDALESPETMRICALEALQIARRAGASKRRRPE